MAIYRFTSNLLHWSEPLPDGYDLTPEYRAQYERRWGHWKAGDPPPADWITPMESGKK